MTASNDRASALAVLVGLASLLISGCEAPPREELIAGKACGANGECAPGFVCNTATNVCVTEAQLGGGGTGGSGGCTSVADCPPTGSVCEVPICLGGVCGTSALPMGSDAGTGDVGDCQSQICDGAGQTIPIIDDEDVAPSTDCLGVICNTGVLQEKPSAVGAECDRGGGAFCDAEQTCVECLAESNCTELPKSDECRQRTCDGGTCGETYTAQGFEIASQTAGDCNVNVCDGNGVPMSAPDNDPLDDLNGCTINGCNNGSATEVLATVGSPCGVAGLCNAAGQCTGCITGEDCAVATFCAQPTCELGICGVQLTEDGTPLPPAQQQSGDCQVLQCNDVGSVTSVAAMDPPADDGLECTGETCVTGSPQHPPLPPDTSCGPGGAEVCDGNGACVQCNSPGQCANSGTVCQVATCELHQCGIDDLPAGTIAPVNVQTTGDCSVVVCDGAGNTTAEDSDLDLPVDGNECTFDVCTQGNASHPPAPVNTPCGPAGAGVCDGAGQCTAKKTNGSVCGAAVECESGFCPAADGICCDEACTGTCEACAAAKTGSANGSCASIDVGEDPDVECFAQGETCDGSGSCDFLCGQDPTPPTGSCPAACTGGCGGGICFIDCNSASCAPSVTCPPGLACQVQCSGAECDNTAISCPSVYACEVLCGVGACDGVEVACSSGNCMLDCEGSGSCTNAEVNCGPNECSAVCAADSAVPSVLCGTACDCTDCLRPAGAACTNASQCESGNCPLADLVCCDTACGGACRSCLAADTGGVDGSCDFVTQGSDPANECAGTLACSGAGACALLANGVACIDDAECANGNCPVQDGICCNAVCDGLCESCSASRTAAPDGVCAAITLGEDPNNECEDAQTCDGAFGCQ
jgi:hypothetical protein